ncbi:MOSC domain-containing protein [Methylobacterium sp. C1]|uniref:MOSC domain-containing protein n=1 Tax=Methylobacterium sp. C1 TaxID=1479019 RepID=UPI0008D924CF|nr:MOSC domain-containing protein [Methylobacterium sp. C1]
MNIVSLFRYPVKGLSAEGLPQVELRAGHGFPDDRRYAVTDGSLAFDPEHPVPAPKTQFLMLAKYHRLARLKTRFRPSPDRLEVEDGDGARTFDLEPELGRQELADYLAKVVQEPLPGTPRVVSAQGHQFTDVSVHSVSLMRSVSLINLATVEDLGTHLGRDLDPIRFRANIYFDGAEAWSELDWLGRRLSIGGTVLKVVRRTKRCAATNVNPRTAERDANLPLAIREYRDHGDLGFYAEVEEEGCIAPGDTLRLDPA